MNWRFRAATDDYPMAPGNEAPRRSVVLARRRTQFGPMPTFGEGPASHGDGKAGSASCCQGRREVGLPRLLMFSENVLAN